MAPFENILMYLKLQLRGCNLSYFPFMSPLFSLLSSLTKVVPLPLPPPHSPLPPFFLAVHAVLPA